jgi:hypothetical protein
MHKLGGGNRLLLNQLRASLQAVTRSLGVTAWSLGAAPDDTSAASSELCKGRRLQQKKTGSLVCYERVSQRRLDFCWDVSRS